MQLECDTGGEGTSVGPRFPAASGGDFWAVWNSAGPRSLVPLWSAGVSDLTGVISAGVFVASTSHLAGRQGFTRVSFLLGLPYHRTYGDGFAFLRDIAGAKLLLLQGREPLGDVPAQVLPAMSMVGAFSLHTGSSHLSCSRGWAELCCQDWRGGFALV